MGSTIALMGDVAAAAAAVAAAGVKAEMVEGIRGAAEETGVPGAAGAGRTTEKPPFGAFGDGVWAGNVLVKPTFPTKPPYPTPPFPTMPFPAPPFPSTLLTTPPFGMKVEVEGMES